MASSVRQTTSRTVLAEASSADPTINRNGVTVVQDFWLYHLLAGNMFSVRAGTVTTPLVGDVVITDTAAEMCLDVGAAAMALIPNVNITFRLGTGTLFESAGKSVAAVSTVGAAFVPLPARKGGRVATATARVAAAGGVTVTAELATTTKRHFAWSQPIAAGAWSTWYDPPNLVRIPAMIYQTECFYLQIAATTTGPSYYASFDFLDDLDGSMI